MGGNVQKIKNFMRDLDKKPLHKMVFEMIELTIRNKELPRHYLTRFLYKKDCGNIGDFLTVKENNYLHRKFGRANQEALILLNNKLYFHLFMQKFDIRVPRLLGYNFSDKYYITDNEFVLSSDEFFEKLATDHVAVFAKPIDGNQGRGCCKLVLENNWHLELLKKGQAYIFEEVVQQHRLINSIYGNSLNTLRFISVNNKDKGEIITAYMRFGRNGTQVDNASSGGMIVAIDLERGCLTGLGKELLQYGWKRWERHPDSQVRFDGFTIPFFADVICLIHELMDMLPNVLVGWDVGITNEGPVLIEANAQPGFASPDLAYGGLRQHSTIRHLLTR